MIILASFVTKRCDFTAQHRKSAENCVRRDHRQIDDGRCAGDDVAADDNYDDCGRRRKADDLTEA